ncbi:unnamed protein product [Cylicocyclus nassatus]|uniref:Uncharacterized protein n=1 Tax=Cylicocyclus nassatus TaxID=53992 RepID=A0AA36GQK0_CYLNA|nr:unnamed protein product [Cylicocyclus nassatus]
MYFTLEQHRWFNLRIDELGEVSAQVKRRSISRKSSADEGEKLMAWANDIKSQSYLQMRRYATKRNGSSKNDTVA